jgi:hypothetical protein
LVSFSIYTIIGDAMDIDLQNYDILKKLIENEIIIAELYLIYARQDQKNQKFWTDLANEEYQHARMIEELSKRKDLSISMMKDRFTPEVFNISFLFLEEKKDQAEKEKLTFKEALSIALDIETGMLEREYFKIFEGDSQEFQKILAILDELTQKHCNKIRKILSQKKWFFF